MPAISKLREIEKREQRPISDVLCDAYRELGSQKAVAVRLGVSPAQISIWIRLCGYQPWTIIVPSKPRKMPRRRSTC